jgi:transposase InsO family protein
VETAAVTVRREEPRANAMWQIDASEAPVWVFHPTGTISKIDDSANYVKPWVISIIDCATRVQMALRSFIKAPTTADALHTVRWAIAASRDPRKFAYGKPAIINSDNHKIFHPNGDWGLSLLQAGIDPQQGPNESPHANGKVERLFQTMEYRIWTNLSSYANQYEGLAKAKESCIPWILFQRYIERASYQNYNLVDHSELQRTPYEAWQAMLPDAAGLIYDVPAIEKALRITREYTVATDGIEVAPLRRYTGTVFEGLIKEKVTVRIPPPPEPLPDKLPVFKDGIPLGEITCVIDDSIAQELRDTRLARTIAIDRLRNILIEQGRKDPLPGDPSLPPQLVANTVAGLPPEHPASGTLPVPPGLDAVDSLAPAKKQVVNNQETVGPIPTLQTGDTESHD